MRLHCPLHAPSGGGTAPLPTDPPNTGMLAAREIFTEME
jgi:hypothetical protein